MEKIQIGKFTISQSPHSKENVWIEKDDGEGSEFKISLLEKFINFFYNLYF